MSASELALRTRFQRVLVSDDAVDEDTQLVERFLRGERVAFEQLVRKYQKPIYFFILRHVPDADEAQDLSFREVADILGTSEGAAKVNYHYAVKRLKEWLGADVVEEEKES